MRIFLTVLICLSIALAFASRASASTIDARAEQARPMTPTELRSLYGNKSWQWKTGYAYFGVKERRFTSALRNGTYADGVWFLPGDGKLCYRATWYERSGTYKDLLNCTQHRIDDRGRIYQRTMPDGDWYVFRNAPKRGGDEAAKLRSGNYVKNLYEKNERRLNG